MMPSMSRPGNPYDNASCESFMKTLKREEIYANEYRDLGHLVESVEDLIEHYYNETAFSFRSKLANDQKKVRRRIRTAKR